MQTAKFNGRAWEGAMNGAEQAKDHANAELPGWEESAYAFFVQYANLTRSNFMTEDVVEAAKSIPHLAAPDNRAWGAIARKASFNKVVESVGLGYSHKGKGNAAPRTVWKLA